MTIRLCGRHALGAQRVQGVIIALHPLCQYRVSLPDAAFGDCHEQRLFLTHQRYAAFRTGDCRVEQIPCEKHLVRREQGKSTIKRRVQAAKHMIPEAKQILRQGNVDITKTDALRLSKLPPEQQIVAATQFSEGKISTLRGYQADDSEETESDSAESEQQDDNAPFQFSNKCFSDFKESVADLKDPEKDCSCSTGSFLAEVTSSVKQIHKIIECYSTPYYMAVFPELDEKQTDYLKDLLESVGDAAMQLYNSITERTSFDGKS